MDKFKTEVNDVLDSLADLDPETEEYTKAVGNLKTLTEAETLHKGERAKLDPNGVLKTTAYLGGLTLTLLWEERHVIAKKAWGLLMRIF